MDERVSQPMATLAGEILRKNAQRTNWTHRMIHPGKQES